jgi:hypothetical protein
MALKARRQSGTEDFPNKLDEIDQSFGENEEEKVNVSSKTKKDRQRRSAKSKKSKMSLSKVIPGHVSDSDDDEKEQKSQSPPRLSSINGALESLMMSPKVKITQSVSMKSLNASSISSYGTPATMKRTGLLLGLKGKLRSPNNLDEMSDGTLESTQSSQATPTTLKSPGASKTKMVPKTKSPALWAAAMNSQNSQQARTPNHSSLDRTFAEFSQSAHATASKNPSGHQVVSQSMHAGAAPVVRGRSLSKSRNRGTAVSSNLHRPSAPTSLSSPLARRKQRHEISVSQHDDPSEALQATSATSMIATNSREIARYAAPPPPLPSPSKPVLQSYPLTPRSMSARSSGRPSPRSSGRAPTRSPGGSAGLVRSHSEPKRKSLPRRSLKREDSSKRNSLQQIIKEHQPLLRSSHDNTANHPRPISSPGKHKLRRKGDGPPPTQSSAGLRYALTSQKKSIEKGVSRSRSSSNTAARRSHSSEEQQTPVQLTSPGRVPVGQRRSLSRTRKAKAGPSPTDARRKRA